MQVRRLLTRWGIGAVRAVEPVSQHVNRVETACGQVYYLKGHGGVRSIRAYPLLRFLNEQGVRVEVPLPTLNGEILTREEQQGWALYAALPGAPLEVASCRQLEAHARILGSAVGRLHRCLEQYPESEASLFDHLDLLANVERLGNETGLRLMPADRLRFGRVLSELSEGLTPLLPHLRQHLIHRDSHPSNVIFDQEGEPGFVDFDLACHCVRIFDPCYMSTGLLMGLFEETAGRVAWSSVINQVISGYDSVCALKEAERRALKYVSWAIQVIFTCWWSRAGDVELMDKNMRLLWWLFDHYPG